MTAPLARTSRTVRAALLGALLLSLVACKTELHSDLAEADANEALSVLLANGVDATKEMGEEGSYRLWVERSQFGTAVEILSSHGLPRRKFERFGDVFKSDGLITSPTQEWARYNYAVTQELAASIASIPGVLTADVHLANPKSNNPFDEPETPTASVMMQISASAVQEDLVPKVKRLVSFGVQEVSYDNVSVFLSPIRPSVGRSEMVSVGGMIVQRASAGWLRFLAAAVGLAFMACGAAAYLAFRFHRQLKRQQSGA